MDPYQINGRTSNFERYLIFRFLIVGPFNNAISFVWYTALAYSYILRSYKNIFTFFKLVFQNHYGISGLLDLSEDDRKPYPATHILLFMDKGSHTDGRCPSHTLLPIKWWTPVNWLHSSQNLSMQSKLID